MMTGRRTFTLGIVTLVGITVASSVWADKVAVPTGEVNGRIVSDQQDYVLIETLAGDEVAISREVIMKIARRSEVDFLLDRGSFLENKGRDEEAYWEYIEVLKRDPNNEEALKRMEEMKLRHRREQWNKGIEQARKLVASEQYRKALQAFQSVLADHPEDRLAQTIVEEMCKTYAKIAYLYYNHCYDEGAITELAKAEELNPDNAEIYYLLGRIHETDGHLDLARQEYEHALEKDPNHVEARTRLNSVLNEQERQLQRLRRG